jgi:uncharacterized repeat protein (TIGR01451 family)
MIRLAGLFALLALVLSGASAQTPIGTVITNQARITHTVPGGGFPSTDTSNSSAITVAGATLTLTKSVSPASAVPGDTVTWTIVVGNVSVDPLASVVVTDTIPASLVAVSATGGTLSGNVLTWNVGTIQPGARDTVQVRAWMPGQVATGSVVTNQVGASDSAGTAAVSSAGLLVGASPRLAFSKSVSSPLVNGGDTLTYALHFANTGNAVLTNVTLRDTLPAGVAFLSATPGVTVTGGVATITIDSLGLGAADSALVRVVVAGGLAGGSGIVNTAHAASDQTADQSASAGSTVQGHASLAFTKSASADTVVYGDTLRYTLRVANTGNLALAAVAIVDTLPPAMTFVGASAGSAAGNVFAATIASLPMGATDSVVVTVRVSGIGSQPVVLANRAWIQSDLTPSQVAQADVVYRALPSFTIQKTADTDTLIIGNDVTYTITAANTGNVPLTAFALRDTVPASLTNIRVSSNATLAGSVVSLARDTLAVNERDTVRITATLALSAVPEVLLANRAWGHTPLAADQFSTAVLLTSLPPSLASCRLTIGAFPTTIYGDVADSSVITIYFTDTTGTPKPDGTPVRLFGPGMLFSNGRDTITRATLNGIVSEPVKFRWTGVGQTTQPVLVTGTDPAGCSATDSVMITFTPGALTGSVRDIRNGAAVAGATINVTTSNNTPVAARTSTPRGTYLVPLPATGTYLSTISAQDEFSRTVGASMSVLADLSGASPVAPVPNANSVSGRIYFGPSHQPIAAAGVQIVLFDSSSNAAIDTVATDTTGAFSFSGFAPGASNLSAFASGAFVAVIVDQRYSGGSRFHHNGGGEHLINANIPVAPGPGLTFRKTGPATIFAGDTLRYTIQFDNTAALLLHNASIADTLDPRLRFVSATGGGVYDAPSRSVVWNVAGADSGVAASFVLTVIPGDTATQPFTVVNNAVLAADEIYPYVTSAVTAVQIESKLNIWKTVSDAEASAGDTLTYSIYVENASHARADSIVIRDVLPQELEFVSASPQAQFTVASATYAWTADSLLPGESRTYTVVARIRTDLGYGVHEFTNYAALQWFGGQSNSSLDARSQATTSLVVPYLRVTKQAVRRIVEVGDLALYTIDVTNLSQTSAAYDVTVVDAPPLGFRYAAGSSFRDTTRIDDPEVGRELVWTLADSIAPGATVRLTYRLAVGAGALDGTGVNTAYASALTPLGQRMVSAVSSDRVEIRAGVFTERGLVVGKVFYDDNENIWQDPGEEGLKGIELLMEDGTRVITGDDGKFSLPDVSPGEHVLRLRETTLPPGDELLLGYSDFAYVASSRFVRVPESGIARADFYVRRAPRASTTITQSVGVYGAVTIQRLSDPKDLVFVKDSRIMPISIKGTLFEVGKANLKKEALPTLKAVADYAREYPDQMLAISGHTDASPIHTKEFPSNQELSEARAEAVKAYLVTDEGIYPARITTSGFGPSQPVATNSTKDGRSLNRRVEIMMTTEGRVFENYYRTIHIRIPVSYHGTAPVTSLEIRDRLDTAFHFVDGSGRFAGAAIAPADNTDLLTWTIPNVGVSMADTLSYDVRVYAPKAGMRAARSSSTLSYTINGASATLDASCWTTNVIARTVKNTPVRLVVPGAFVDAETAELTIEALNDLQGAADILKAFPNATALIEGHTGPRDPEAAGFSSNVALSRARAVAVLHALATKFGIDSSRMQATGWGELKPSSVKDKSANNRVEILIDKPDPGAQTYHEDRADTSETLSRTIGEPVDGGTPAVGDRVVLTITATAPLGRDVRSIAVNDTLPAGVVPEEGSLTAVRGVDTLSIAGNVIRMQWSATDTVHSYRITATLSGSGEQSRRLSITRTIGTRTMIEIPEAVKLRVEATKGRTRP